MYFAPRIVLRVLHHVNIPEPLGSQRRLEVPAVLGAVVHQFEDCIFAVTFLQFLLVIFSTLPDGNRYDMRQSVQEVKIIYPQSKPRSFFLSSFFLTAGSTWAKSGLELPFSSSSPWSWSFPLLSVSSLGISWLTFSLPSSADLSESSIAFSMSVSAWLTRTNKSSAVDLGGFLKKPSIRDCFFERDFLLESDNSLEY